MPKPSLSYLNRWPSGTVTSSSEDTNFPASNTQRQSRSWEWRTAGLTSGGDWIQVALGQNLLVNALHLIDANLTAASVITVNGYALGSGSPSYTGTFRGGVEIATLWIPDKTLATWNIEIDDAANPDGYLSVGSIFLGLAFRPKRGFQRLPEDPGSRSVSGRSVGGQKSGVRRDPVKVRSYLFQASDEKDTFDDIFEEVDTLGAVVFCEDWKDPTDANTFYATIGSYAPSPVVIGFWDVTLSFEEEL